MTSNLDPQNQPPVWQGTPLGEPEILPTSPIPEASSPAQQVPSPPVVDVGTMLRETWQLIRTQSAALARVGIRGGLLALPILIGTSGILYSQFPEYFVQKIPLEPEAFASFEFRSTILVSAVYATVNSLVQTWLTTTSGAAAFPDRQGPTGSRVWRRYFVSQIWGLLILGVALIPTLALTISLGNVLNDNPLLAAVLALAALATLAGWTVLAVWFFLSTLPSLGLALDTEGSGFGLIKESIKASRRLRWKMFVPYFVVSLLAGMAGQIASSLISATSQDKWLTEAPWLLAAFDGTAGAISMAVSVPLQSVVLIVMYRRLIARRTS